MKKVVLIDGNNLLFRSYYATAYSGNMMKNSKGFPTNALYGFVTMLNKIINEEKPEYMLVSLDKGKTFRHDNYQDYKAGRAETPEESMKQIEKARALLDSMGITWAECDGYEADDIIGTVAHKMTDKDYDVLIISSDKDLLQLINKDVIVKLLKTKDYILMDHNEFMNAYGIEPIRMIDLKGLQGDASDNIPGVKGIGEKTALKLLQDYESVENIYVHIDEIGGKLKEKLLESKDDAFMSKQLATIYKDVPIKVTIDDLKYDGPDNNKLKAMYEELEFYSLTKNMKEDKKIEKEFKYEVIDNIKDLNVEGNVAVYIELDKP
jgi:DNA polymerase-1